MKAKEYAERYRAGPTDKMLVRVAFDMLVETKALMEQRHVQTNAAVYSILNEIDKKWRAFVRIVGDPSIKLDGFEQLIKKEMPLIYIFWKQRKF